MMHFDNMGCVGDIGEISSKSSNKTQDTPPVQFHKGLGILLLAAAAPRQTWNPWSPAKHSSARGVICFAHLRAAHLHNPPTPGDDRILVRG